MKKRTIIIISVVLTLLSIVYTIISYYGIDRYFILHFKNPDRFIENYKNLPKANKGRIIVSLSPTKKQIKKLMVPIISILDQTVRVDQIIMVLPPGIYKKDFPEYVSKIVNFQQAGKDYGKGTKLIPVLLREKECDTVIIALNVDIVYGKDFLESMIEQMKNNHGVVLMDTSGSSILVKPDYFGCDVIDRQKDKFDNEWFQQKAKQSKIINYNENYKVF